METLTRFVDAQAGGIWDAALAELERGAKRGHWMWFVLPQIDGLGRSATARAYAIRDIDEARAYLAHPVLGARLVTAATVLAGWAGRRSASAIMGEVDAMKLRSCATLFEVAAGMTLPGGAGGGTAFGAVLDGLFASDRDAATLRILGRRG